MDKETLVDYLRTVGKEKEILLSAKMKNEIAVLLERQERKLETAEKQINELQAHNTRLLGSVRWMKYIGKSFETQAPAEIAIYRIFSSMRTVAEEALSAKPSDSLTWMEALVDAVVFVTNKFRADLADGYITKDKQFVVEILSQALSYKSPKKLTGTVTKLVTALEEALHHDYITPELHEALREYRGMK